MQSRKFSFETGAVTHAGRVRELNEDNYFIAPNGGAWSIAVVADGMGGHEAGDLASHEIVDQMQSIGIPVSAPDLRARFEDRVNRANDAILDLSRQKNGVTIGSTLAALLTYERQYACVWSGDSRVYRISGGEISRLSRDHTEVQDLLDSGVITPEEARTWPRRNVITRAIGVGSPAPLEIIQGYIEGGDCFVICSDGLTGHVSDAEILDRVSGTLPQDACQALLDLTLERGAVDNVTIIVVRCIPVDEPLIVYD